MTRLLQSWLSAYWSWMSSGSLPRFAIGYGAPLVLLAFAVHSVKGTETPPSDFAALGATPAVTAQVAGALAAASPQAAASPAQPATAATATPTVGRSVLTYVVKSGDSLGAICSAQVPSMSIEACVTAIVQLNKLSGPNQLSVGQSLSLPAAGTSTSATTQATPPANSTAATTTGSAAAPSTPRPTSTGAAAQQSPGTVSIDFITKPLKPGQTATLKATVAPNASCSLRYTPPSGTPSTAAGLTAKAADGAGNITWNWEIGGNTKKGTGTVVVTCGATAVSSYIEIS